MRNNTLRFAVLSILTAGGTILFAAPSGNLTVGICNVQGAGVRVTGPLGSPANTIDWLPPAGGPDGCTLTGVGTNLSYTGGGPLLSNVQGSIKDLTLGGGTVFDFMTFTGNPNLHFDLTALGPGPVNTVCSNAFDPNAASCSVAPGSPFKLTPTATGTDVTLAATGIARDSSAQTSQWMGNFSTTFPGITPAQVQDAILNGTTVGLFCSNHACSSTYSGTFTVSILPAGNGCTLTQGGYKNHFNSLVLNFPGIPNGSHGLTIGTVFYTNAQLNAILQNNAIRGNGLLALAHQLITAELNLAYGGVPSDPAQVAALNNAITAANALIGGLVIPPIGNGELSPSLTGTLTNFFDDYNNGNFGVPHCN